MKRIYKGKSNLRILINTKCNLSCYESVFICYKKPDDTLGRFAAHVKDINKGIIFYDAVSSDDFDMAGFWTIWVEAIFDDGRDCCSRAVRVFVYECGAL